VRGPSVWLVRAVDRGEVDGTAREEGGQRARRVGGFKFERRRAHRMVLAQVHPVFLRPGLVESVPQ